MKLLRSCHCGISRVFRVLFYSTETQTSSASRDTLYSRISPAGDARVSIVPVLDQWIEEGNSVKQKELQRIIKTLRKYRRFNHALQISEWMNGRRFLDLSPGDVAVRLDLISKVHGLDQAEKYFDNIPDTLRVFQVYGALLNCYARKKSLEKAEAVMQKMRELGFLRTPLSYNVMLHLYSQMGKHEKLDTLMQEMKEKGIYWDRFTFNIRLNAYAAASDIEGMEKLLKKMEADPLVTMDWNAYVAAANGYLKAGLEEKALSMLKKSEQLIRGKTMRFGYEYILTLYAAMGNKDEVYRIWNSYKKMGKVYKGGYICMISSLIKLDDIDGAEKILEECESGNASLDFQVSNLLLSAYCRKGLLEKAEAFVSSAIESGKEPSASTWDRLATGYHQDNQMAKAVETMKKAILANRPGWKRNLVTLTACLEYLKEKGDVEAAEEFIRFLREQGHFSQISTTDYVKNGKPGSDALDEIEGDAQDLDGETHGVMELKYQSNS